MLQNLMVIPGRPQTVPALTNYFREKKRSGRYWLCGACTFFWDVPSKKRRSTHIKSTHRYRPRSGAIHIFHKICPVLPRSGRGLMENARKLERNGKEYAPYFSEFPGPTARHIFAYFSKYGVVFVCACCFFLPACM